MQPHHPLKRALPLAGALAPLAAAPAAAALPAPITLTGSGGHPQLAVDGSGRGHLVWNDHQAPTQDIGRYCRVARGASSCQTTRTLQPSSATARTTTSSAGPTCSSPGPTKSTCS